MTDETGAPVITTAEPAPEEPEEGTGVEPEPDETPDDDGDVTSDEQIEGVEPKQPDEVAADTPYADQEAQKIENAEGGEA